MTIVIALDSFKGSISSHDAAEAFAAGWRSVAPSHDLLNLALADGGEGTLDALASAPGAVRHTVRATAPDDRPVEADWLELAGPHRVGVIELAQSSGITLLGELAPLTAHTRGLGEVINAALDAGVDELLIAVGGSASTDGGTGALRALGVQFLDRDGRELAMGGAALARLDSIDTWSLRRTPRFGVTILSDVTNPLTGPRGAAAVYGPQKGATESDVALLDAALAHFESVAQRDVQRWAKPVPAGSLPGAGAAGGTGFGLALWGARITSGASAVADAVGLDAALESATLVVTGEGKFDGQSGQGKVVSEVQARAHRAGVPCALVAGAIDAPTDDFAHAVALAELAGSAQASIDHPATWLHAAGAKLARQTA